MIGPHGWQYQEEEQEATDVTFPEGLQAAVCPGLQSPLGTATVSSQGS